jgi:hypothetical protein
MFNILILQIDDPFILASHEDQSPKTQSANQDIRATIQQMATDIQELKQNRQFTTHSSEETHRNWRGRGQASIASRNNFCPRPSKCPSILAS